MRNMISCFRPNKDAEKEAEDMVIRNGGLLLEKFVALTNGRGHSTRSFSLNDLNTATNNYAPDREIYSDGLYILYNGFLQTRHVMVKKYNYDFQLHYCIADIVFPSQLIMHKNVLKLLGCCLEPSIPILVFEFAEKGSLDDYIYTNYRRHGCRPLSWKIRLKIAADVANVIAYLHTGFSRPIVHGGIRTENILLDENYGAKVSDFSLSVSIPEGETHVYYERIGGPWDFLTPEYLTEGIVNEKTDVFSFGIVLFMLLTRGNFRNPLHINSVPEDDNICGDAIKEHMENDTDEAIFDPIIVEEEPWPGKEQQLKAFLMLALHCTRKDPEERPEITAVGKQLRQMYQSLVSNCVHQH